jgi:hypothetical protein
MTAFFCLFLQSPCRWKVTTLPERSNHSVKSATNDEKTMARISCFSLPIVRATPRKSNVRVVSAINKNNEEKGSVTDSR